jgi:hypothetical protein
MQGNKLVCWRDNKLYLKLPDGTEECLGGIRTRKGGLTRVEKLKAVAANGDWIAIS